MAIQLSEKLMDEIHQHAKLDFPQECCGVMVGLAKGDEKQITLLHRASNTHEDGHERRYLISPDELRAIDKSARANGATIIGIYHSHPNHPSIPSGYDKEWAWPWYSYIIVSVMDGIPTNTTSWVLLDDRSAFEPESITINP